MFIELQVTAKTVPYRVLVNELVSFQLAGTLISEEIVFEQPNGIGGWQPVVIDGTPIVLSATNTIVTLDKPCKIRINKPITTNQVGVIKV